MAEILQDPGKGKPSAKESAEALRDKTNVSLWGPGSSLLHIPPRKQLIRKRSWKGEICQV